MGRAEAVTSAAADAEPNGERPPWAALVALSAGVSLIIIDATIVNVALPTISRELQVSASQAIWVVTA